jgi:hypothetical protein
MASLVAAKGMRFIFFGIQKPSESPHVGCCTPVGVLGAEIWHLEIRRRAVLIAPALGKTAFRWVHWSP